MKAPVIHAGDETERAVRRRDLSRTSPTYDTIANIKKVILLYGCQQVLLKPDPELAAVLEFICSETNKLMNCGIYYARQIWFKCRRIIGKYDLEKEHKPNKHFQALYSQAAQQALRTVSEFFKSFEGLNKAFKKGKITEKPRPPKYLKKGGLAVVSYPKQALKLKDGHIRIPLGTLIKTWFKLADFIISA